MTTEQRFDRTPDGRVWTCGGAPYVFWTRYLDVFDEVRVVARLRHVSEAGDGCRADGLGVSFCNVPHYVGPYEYAARLPSVRRAILGAVREPGALILRVPSPMTGVLTARLSDHRPYGLEVVGDPFEVFAPGSIRHVLRGVLRSWNTSLLQKQCQFASAVAFVTGASLQARYKPGPLTFTTSYSSIDLCEDAFVLEPRRPDAELENVAVVSVGSMEQFYKGFDVLIDACALCRASGVAVCVTLVGDGRCRGALERRAAAMGISDHVHFTGRLNTAEVRSQLDRANIFVLASKAEGLPRAMIEAMARGLPCVGTVVGGIPELLPSEDLVPSGNPDALARKLREVACDSERMARMSARNLSEARRYDGTALRPKRNEFMRVLRNATDTWMQQRQSAAA